MKPPLEGHFSPVHISRKSFDATSADSNGFCGFCGFQKRKKYKHCCLNKPVGTIKPSSAIGTLDEVLHPKPRVSKLAIMRILQDGINNPKLVEKLREGLRKNWTFGKLKEMETSEIVERLKSIDADFGIASFKEDAGSPRRGG